MANCADCGFITLRDEKTRGFIEVEDIYRKTGAFSRNGLFGIYPLCFKDIYCIPNEVETARKKVGDEVKDDGVGGQILPQYAKYIKEVLDTSRDCNHFRKWQQGYSPKEHQGMIDREHERRWHIIEVTLILVVGLIASIGSALVGAWIANGRLP
jgi:hypothetical protein